VIFDHMKKAMILFLFMSVSFGMLAQDQLLNVAKQYLLSGDYIKAAATFKQLVDYNQEDATVLLGYFESLKGLKDYKTAEKIIKQQLKLNDKNVSYQFELAKLYKLQGEDKKATKIVESIIHQLKPEDDAIRNTAMMFQKEGMFNEAICRF
jgi:tetratricopeptide (TPR) repeat protein